MCYCASCMLVRVQVAQGPRGSGDLEPHFSVQRRLNALQLRLDPNVEVIRVLLLYLIRPSVIVTLNQP